MPLQGNAGRRTRSPDQLASSALCGRAPEAEHEEERIVRSHVLRRLGWFGGAAAFAALAVAIPASAVSGGYQTGEAPYVTLTPPLAPDRSYR